MFVAAVKEAKVVNVVAKIANVVASAVVMLLASVDAAAKIMDVVTKIVKAVKRVAKKKLAGRINRKASHRSQDLERWLRGES